MDIEIYKVLNEPKLVSYLRRTKNIDIYTGFKLTDKVKYPLLNGYHTYFLRIYNVSPNDADILEECCKFTILNQWLIPINNK